MAAPHKAIVIGISGPSSSGKTTLSRLLRDIFPNTFIVHEDDFYLPEEKLPKKDDLIDWDCAESLNIPRIAETLEYVHENAALPPDLDSYQDRNSVGECPVPDEAIAEVKSQVKEWLQPGNPGHGILQDTSNPTSICLFDGFLLYSDSLAPVQSQLDLKLFLRVSYAKAKARREARSGYATLEGFWEDPPGYVDKIVWPNYVENHKWMFEDGDVDGQLKKDVLADKGIKCQDGVPDVDMTTTLRWAVATITESLPSLAKHN
ncbi:nicotinamide riboside kinase 1 protein [Rutstroemia sp. NJR-2017a WRK4]|nr:nicotinamide riboside kinase 1 protein [Rutstroemia sp. NJR-2017a WRK4]